MLMRSDPFRDLERFTQEAFGRQRANVMAMDAYRSGDKYVVHFDLPGVDASSIDLTVEKNALTVSAERSWPVTDDIQMVVSERPEGKFSRQLLLGEGLDAERVEANYHDGVLTVTIPVAEQAKPRKIAVSSAAGATSTIETTASE